MKTNIILKRELAVWVTIPLIAVALLGAAACSKPTSAARPGDPPDVEVARVEQKDVPIYGEWIGTLDGMVNADVKAQVTGYLLAQAYRSEERRVGKECRSRRRQYQ